ncbi:phenylacetate--CoA ligase family protein [Neobacillus niacini]|uniref:phenylacetate--CoA ligase family protein n=1 Tax=Neobacillus niacini TaxID=86668 RepID=UPI0021CB2505|nr:phenylacetate--CoA ligase family protein [Neobacillus niacini]MCM3766953.1 phenylacetate--CoA ligase family protein [Neobacillus niacini]
MPITKSFAKEVKYTNPMFNQMSEEEIFQYQEQLLQKQLRYVYRNSEFYRKKFNEIGVHPEEIKSIHDFRQLPAFMDKTIERENQKESREKWGHPFGTHLCCSPDEIEFTGTTSGTSGEPTFTYTFTKEDLNFLNRYIAHMLEYGGVFPGDRLLFSHALGIYATSSILWGIRSQGVLPIDVDVRAGSAMILRYADMTKPTAAMMTPSLAEHLIDKASELIGKRVGDLGLKALFTVGEMGIGIPEVKKKIETAYGCRVYDYLGEFGFSCDSDEYYGIHCVAPDLGLFPLDLVDPETKLPIEIRDGVIGEIIATEFNLKASPRIRFATGDVIQVFTHDCPGCGFKGKRFRFLGRSDDMLIIKGANVYPSAIKKVIAKFVPDVTGEIRIVLDNPPPRVVPPLELKVEYGYHFDQRQLLGLEEKIKNALHTEARVTPQIIWCEPGTLEKAMTKTPLFEKNY